MRWKEKLYEAPLAQTATIASIESVVNDLNL